MANSTLRKKPRRENKPMTIDLQPGRDSSIRFILGYSKALRVVEAPPVGTIDIVLNGMG